MLSLQDYCHPCSPILGTFNYSISGGLKLRVVTLAQVLNFPARNVVQHCFDCSATALNCPEHDVHYPGLVIAVLLVIMEAAELVGKCLRWLRPLI